MALHISEAKSGLNVALCNLEKKKTNTDKSSYNCVTKYILNILNR